MAIDIISTLPVHPTKKPKLRDITPFSGDIDTIVVHTTNCTSTIQALANYDVSPYTIYNGEKIWNHISKSGCPSITYSDIIKENAKIYHCAPYEWETWHAGNVNFRSIAVAMNFVAEADGQEYAPKSEMLKALYSHLGWLCLDRGISPNKIIGHREVKDSGWFWYKGSRRLRKTCPGMLVDLDLMRTQATKYLQFNLKVNGLYTDGRIDGLFGPLTWAAMRDFHSR